MNTKISYHCLLFIGIVIALTGIPVIAQDKPPSTTETSVSAPSTQSAPVSSSSFKKYPDHAFNAKEYIEGMSKGGHNLLIWKDTSVDLSKYSSVKLTEFGGRLLPEQNIFSYDPYVALFNSVFKSSLKLPLKDAPEALIIEGAVVECNPGSRAARAWVGFGAGRAGCAVVCEVYEPGKTNPCIRIYTRDTGSSGSFGGDSVAMLNNIMGQIATRLGTTLNTTINLK